MKKYLLLAVMIGCVTFLASVSTAKADHFHGGYRGGYGHHHHHPGYYGRGYGYGRPYYARPYYGGGYYGGYYGGYPAYGSGLGIVIQRPGFSFGVGSYGW